ncbi:MAG: thioredoxin family protein [Panacagrimonas sp.]
MALTASRMMPLDTPAPNFVLDDVVSGGRLALADVRGRTGTLVMFICNHCPYVKHVNGELVRLANDHRSRGVGIVAINSNDAVKYPDDAPSKMKEAAQALRYPFPYLHDETQAVARAYDATCTPDFFLFDQNLRLTYRGRLDDSTPGNGRPLTGSDLRAALECLLAGTALAADQRPSMGCNIKWK